jgi:F0F1-type ATP synthase epsilon subunit
MISKEMENIYGLIIVGNSGVGKSYLANIILGKQYFKHDFSARSVTHRTESITCILGDKCYRIYNIPGLIEGDEERIALNKREISRAFEEQKEHSLVVIYVFGHQNGRIRNEDIVTFKAIHKAYTFSPDSLITIVNGLPPDRPNTYNEATQATLIGLLGMQPGHICFIDRLKSGDISQKGVQTYLIDTILIVRPQIHIKTDNINLVVDEVFRLKDEVDVLKIKMDDEGDEYKRIITSMKREYEAAQRLSSETNSIYIYIFIGMDLVFIL